MPVLRFPRADADRFVAEIGQLELSGARVVSVADVGDSICVVYEMRPKPGRPAKPKVETR